MSATFVFLMVFLKIPIFALFGIVWWAIHSTPDEPATDDEGGSKRPLQPRPRHPRPARPRSPRRGPHGALPAPSPPRVRSPLTARARSVDRGH